MLGKIAVLLLLVMLVTAACGDDEAAITSATVAPATSTTFTTAEPFGPEDVDGAPPHTHTHTHADNCAVRSPPEFSATDPSSKPTSPRFLA